MEIRKLVVQAAEREASCESAVEERRKTEWRAVEKEASCESAVEEM